MYIFKNFSVGACPRNPRELFLFLNQLQICSAERKYPSKKRENYAPSPLSKFLATPLIAQSHWLNAKFQKYHTASFPAVIID